MKKLFLTSILLIASYQLSFSEITINLNNKINIFPLNSNKIGDILLFSQAVDFEKTISQQNFSDYSDNFKYFEENITEKNEELSQKVDLISNKDDNTQNIEDNDSLGFVPWNKFFYADQQRFTFDGEPALINSKIKPWNTAAVLGFYSVVFYVQHSMQQNTIWKNVGPFNIREDIQYSLWVDKCGHFYGGYSTSYLLSEMLQLSGFSWDAATIWGSVLGMSYMTYVEILDGYSVDFGFSPSDFYADLAGTAFFAAQHYFPVLQNFSPKFEYVNPKWLGEKDRLPHDSFIDNYSAQTFWISINIRKLFGGVVREYIPKWLNIAVGYAAYSLGGLKMMPDGTWDYYYPKEVSTRVNSETSGNRKLIIALDYDLAKMLPDGPPFWNWMKQSLNLFKLPSPAIEFGFEGKTKVYLLYPFQFNLAGIRI